MQKDMVECCDMKSWPRIISEQRWGRTESFTLDTTHLEDLSPLYTVL